MQWYVEDEQGRDLTWITPTGRNVRRTFPTKRQAEEFKRKQRGSKKLRVRRYNANTVGFDQQPIYSSGSSLLAQPSTSTSVGGIDLSLPSGGGGSGTVTGTVGTGGPVGDSLLKPQPGGASGPGTGSGGGYTIPSPGQSSASGPSGSGSGSGGSADSAIDAMNEVSSNQQETASSISAGEAVGAAAVLGAIGLGGWFLTRDRVDDRRIYNATEADAERAWSSWKNEFNSQLPRAEVNRLRDTLKKDFLRGGPLSRAYAQGELSLDFSRKGWAAFGMEYNTINFPPASEIGRGIVVDAVEESKFYYNPEEKEVYTYSELQRKVATGQWIARGNSFVNELGQVVKLEQKKRGQMIPALGMTPEQFREGTPSGAEEEALAEDAILRRGASLRAESERLERELAQLSTLDPAAAIEAERKRAEQQRRTDALAVQRREKQLEIQEEQRLLKEQQQFESTSQGFMRLGSEVSDADVSFQRYKLDRENIENFLKANYGDAVQEFKYARTGRGKDAAGNPTGPDKLIIVWTKEAAKIIGYGSDVPSKQRTETWTRQSLIDNNSLPLGYGVGGVPIWKRGAPPWIERTELARKTSIRLAPSRMKSGAISANRNRYNSTFSRNIKGQRYVVNKWGVQERKVDGKRVAGAMRSLGIRTRLLPVSKGWATYLNRSDVRSYLKKQRELGLGDEDYIPVSYVMTIAGSQRQLDAIKERQRILFEAMKKRQ